jgi:hypothetical protein
MKSKEELITSMCYTARHDYGLEETDSDLLLYSRTELRNKMECIYDACVAPYIEEPSKETDYD